MPKRRFLPSIVSALLCLAAGGCATSSSDPASLIPEQIQASVVAEDRLLGNPSGNGAVSVEDMLARARGSRGDGPAGAATDQSAAQVSEGAEATGSIGAPAATPARTATLPASVPASARAPSVPPEPPEPKPLFEITFDGVEDQPPGPAKDALAKKLKATRLSAKTEVTILTGPGPGTNAFEQAVLANKRARNVRSLLPEGWQIQQVYDPSFPPDTVRIVLGRIS